MKATPSRVALVTGAARGIGLATAVALLERGHRVVISDVTNVDLHQVPSALRDRARAAALDVANPANVAEILAWTEKELGSIGILVNNAGLSLKNAEGKSRGILEVSEDEWARMFAVNVTAIMRLCQRVLPGMRQARWGRIVNVSSLAGRTKSIVAGPTYMASKAAVLGLTRAIASEMGPDGITANCVAPGRILTEMAMQAGEEVNARYAAQIPVRRTGTPEEVADAIAYLAGEQAGFVNGAVIDINGGFYMP
jgi:3-oxoacyl-[acyl-carrier protein] reductase